MSTWALLMGSGENNSEGRGIRILFALLMFVGIVLAGYLLYEHFVYVAPVVHVVPDRSAEIDKARLEKMTENIQAAIEMRAGSSGVVAGAEMLARYPFGAPIVVPKENATLALVPGQAGTTPDAQLSGRYEDVSTESEPAIVPPYISVKGVMSVGKEVVALINIEDEPDGKIYRVGDSFAKNKGKVTGITPTKVTVRYSGKSFEFAH